jgi:hypothetical protein
MPVFHQIGHDSENLLSVPELGRFAGAILSPLNYTPGETLEQISELKKAGKFTLLDPYLYHPPSDKGQLPKWSYYPKDVDTADLSSESWWSPLVSGVAKAAVELDVDAVCSPAIVPKIFSDDFYSQIIEHGSQLKDALKGTKIRPFQTVIANLPELTAPDRVMTIASIISQSDIEDCVLAFISNVEPRRELADPEELKGAMRLISALAHGGQCVTVAFSSSDMILWKAAGATNCATGKFFNLRRFTLSRLLEDSSGGGGQLGYWFEESLLAFLRQSDLLRVQARGLISPASKSNPFCDQILAAIPANKASVALGWRQFLYWFADVEHRIETGGVSPEGLVKLADENWAAIEKSKPPIYMEERPNNGDWVREWLRALVEFPYS